MANTPIVKGQHFVYRHYLEQWSKNKKIYVYVNSKINFTSNRKVGKQRFFYKLGVPSNEEIHILKEFFVDAKFIHKIVSDFNKEMIDNYFLYSSLYKNGIDISPVKEFMFNYIEKYHMAIENDFQGMLPYLLEKDLKCFVGDERRKLILWMAVQQLRTYAVRERVLKKVMNNNNVDLTASWPLISLLFSFNVGLNIHLEKPERQFFFIDNNTEIEFITTDQPVINIDANDADRSPDTFSWFYPLSPRLALFIPEIGTHRDISDNELNIDKVDYLNKLMIKFSELNVFSNSRENLERYVGKN